MNSNTDKLQEEIDETLAEISNQHGEIALLEDEIQWHRRSIDSLKSKLIDLREQLDKLQPKLIGD